MAAEGSRKVASKILDIDFVKNIEEIPVIAGHIFIGGPPGPFDFPSGKLPEKVEPVFESPHQKRIFHHRDQSRGKGHGHAPGHPIAVEPVEHGKKGEIGLNDPFEKPVLLEKDLMFRMPDIGEMGMKHEYKITVCFGHGASRPLFSGAPQLGGHRQ
jgi:hypothetical protein